MADPQTNDPPPPTGPSGPAPRPDPDGPGSRVEAPATPTDEAWRRWCITVGVLMMLLTLLLSVIIPVQSNMLYIANRAFMAVGGGLAAGGVLGFLHIEVQLLRQSIVGGGGLAVFVLLFLVNPPEVAALANLPQDRKAVLDTLKATSGMSSHLIQESTPSLDEVVRGFGYSSFDHFSVTASEADIEAVAEQLLYPQR